MKGVSTASTAEEGTYVRHAACRAGGWTARSQSTFRRRAKQQNWRFRSVDYLGLVRLGTLRVPLRLKFQLPSRPRTLDKTTRPQAHYALQRSSHLARQAKLCPIECGTKGRGGFGVQRRVAQLHGRAVRVLVCRAKHLAAYIRRNSGQCSFLFLPVYL